MAATVRPSDSAAVSGPRSLATRAKATVLFVVIDDALLLDVLAGLTTDEILEALQESGVSTTGCWYYRLSRPVHGDEATGSRSRRDADLVVRTNGPLLREAAAELGVGCSLRSS